MKTSNIILNTIAGSFRLSELEMMIRRDQVKKIIKANPKMKREAQNIEKITKDFRNKYKDKFTGLIK